MFLKTYLALVVIEQVANDNDSLRGILHGYVLENVFVSANKYDVSALVQVPVGECVTDA